MEGSFLPHHAHQVVVAGKTEDSDEIWLVERHGDGYRVVSKAQLPGGRPILIPASEGRRWADVQAHIDGVAPPELKLAQGERVALFVLLWRPTADDGWDGSLYAVVLDARTGTIRLHYFLALDA